VNDLYTEEVRLNVFLNIGPEEFSFGRFQIQAGHEADPLPSYAIEGRDDYVESVNTSFEFKYP
jgi:hypothetical protein